MTTTDRIEKHIALTAPRARVWRAIADSQEFGRWFGLKVSEPFIAGATLHGTIVDPPGYDHLVFTVRIERVEPERLFSFRWHPYAVDPAVDYSEEPTTLVEFILADGARGGTELTVIESGFDRIPAHRRAEAFRANSQGWAEQVERIARYVAQ